VLVGLHTFTGLMLEAFPVNHFLQVVVCCLIAANLSRARPRWWIDVLAALTFITACLTLESGVLVMVVLAAGRVAGRRGVSDRGLAVVAVLLVGSLGLRFGYLSNEVNELGNSSGYGFERLSPEEIRERFGTGLTRFTAYNIMAAMLSVLFSEPRVGVFVLVRDWVAGDVAPYVWIAFATSALTTGVIVAAAVSWFSTPRERRVPAAELFLFVAVLVANAVTSYAYVKTEIVTVAGVFYALAAFWAVRMFLLSTPGRGRGSVIVLAAVLFLAACGWGMRTLGVQNLMRVQAFRLHGDWGRVPETLIETGRWPDEPSARALVIDLRRQALTIPAPNPRFLPRWVDRFFESD
jgi:hypothetical protein